MLQRQFWNILFFGLLSSFAVYNVHFGAGSSSNIVQMSPMPGKQHLLVTSGAGLVGSTLALALLEEGHAVTLLDDASSMGSADKLYRLLQSSNSSVASRLQISSSNEGNVQQLAEVLAAAQPDAIVLLPGQAADKSEFDPLALLSSSSRRVLSLLSAIGNSTVSKVLVSSSLAVYGQAPGVPLTEDTACCKPSSIQGQAALFLEAAVQAYASSTPGFSAVILRHGTAVGAEPQGRLGQSIAGGDSTSGRGSDAVSSCLAAAAAAAGPAPGVQQGLLEVRHHKPLQQRSRPEAQLPAPPDSADAGGSSAAAAAAGGLGGGSSCTKQDYVHVSDLAAAFVAASSTASNPPAVYNVGLGHAYSQQEVWSLCHQLFGVQVPQELKQLPSDEACQGVAADASKFTAHTGWMAKHQFEDALVHSLQWQQTAAAQAQH